MITINPKRAQTTSKTSKTSKTSTTDRKGRPSTVTAAKIKELGVAVNPGSLYYDATHNRVKIISPQGLTMYVTSKKAKGDKEMFYAAAGLRNFMTRRNRKPDDEEYMSILKSARKADSLKDKWGRKYSTRETFKTELGHKETAPAQTSSTKIQSIQTSKEIQKMAKNRKIQQARKNTKMAKIIADCGLNIDSKWLVLDREGQPNESIRIQVPGQPALSISRTKFHVDRRSLLTIADHNKKLMIKNGRSPSKKVLENQMRKWNQLDTTKEPEAPKGTIKTQSGVEMKSESKSTEVAIQKLARELRDDRVVHHSAHNEQASKLQTTHHEEPQGVMARIKRFILG